MCALLYCVVFFLISVLLLPILTIKRYTTIWQHKRLSGYARKKLLSFVWYRF